MLLLHISFSVFTDSRPDCKGKGRSERPFKVISASHRKFYRRTTHGDRDSIFVFHFFTTSSSFSYLLKIEASATDEKVQNWNNKNKQKPLIAFLLYALDLVRFIKWNKKLIFILDF